jgi:hypothetical protein
VVVATRCQTLAVLPIWTTVSKEWRRNIYALLIAGAVIAVLGFIAWRPAMLFGLNDAAVAKSLARALNGGNGECRSIADDRWRCTVDLDPGSGDTRAYIVTAKDRGCWSSRRAPHSPRLGRSTVSGCPSVFDY